MNIKINSKQAAWRLGAIAVAAVVARLAALPPAVADLDGVNFARALRHFDLAAQAPHFPGYPLYVAVARALWSLGASEVLALALPGALLSGVAIFLWGRVVAARVSERAAWVSSLVLALSPLAVLQGASPSSDGVAFAAWIAAAALALSHRAAASGVLAGLMLGLRPSSFVVAVALLATTGPSHRRDFLRGGAAGVASWALPLLALVGPRELWTIGLAFVGGHASEWGGTALVQPDLLERARLLAFNLSEVAFGLPGAAVVAALAMAALLHSSDRGLARDAALWFGALLVWTFLGQNLLKARHVLPLLVPLALWAGLGFEALARRVAAPRLQLAAVAAALVAVLPLRVLAHREPAPALQLQAFAEQTVGTGGMVFLGEEARLFEHRSPQLRFARPQDGAQLRGEAARLAALGVPVYLSSTAPWATALAGLEQVERFSCDRAVRTHAHALTLYRYRPQGAAR